MKSIVFTYPEFRTLPRGLKQMLLTSESLFFSEAKAESFDPASPSRKKRNAWSPPPPSFAPASEALSA